MSKDGKVAEFRVDNAGVQIYSSPQALGAAAASRAAQLIEKAVTARGRARVIVATGNSQIPLIEKLVKLPLNWHAVDVFHMDEYIDIGADHPSSFRYWIRTRVAERVHPGRVFYIEGDAPDANVEIDRYTRLLLEAPIDLAFVGFGENGHIAFNDPHVANFNDPATLKEIRLDEASCAQQAGEGHFKDAASVPQRALTITCPGLFRAASWICSVPERRKAAAVRLAFEGPIAETCPASLVRRHPDAMVYLDTDSASLLSSARSLSAQNTGQLA
jgi:glucosamine-6-phosphate deaminase